MDDTELGDDGDEQRRGEVARGEERGVDGGFALSGLARGGRGRGARGRGGGGRAGRHGLQPHARLLVVT